MASELDVLEWLRECAATRCASDCCWPCGCGAACVHGNHKVEGLEGPIDCGVVAFKSWACLLLMPVPTPLPAASCFHVPSLLPCSDDGAPAAHATAAVV